VKETEIVFFFLFPPDEEAAEPVHPGMSPLHDPPSGPVAGDSLFLLSLLPARADVGRVAPRRHDLLHRIADVSGIQAEVLRRLSRVRPLDRDAP